MDMKVDMGSIENQEEIHGERQCAVCTYLNPVTTNICQMCYTSLLGNEIPTTVDTQAKINNSDAEGAVGFVGEAENYHLTSSKKKPVQILRKLSKGIENQEEIQGERKCAACTYLNPVTTNICQMCYTSLLGNEFPITVDTQTKNNNSDAEGAVGFIGEAENYHLTSSKKVSKSTLKCGIPGCGDLLQSDGLQEEMSALLADVLEAGPSGRDPMLPPHWDRMDKDENFRLVAIPQSHLEFKEVERAFHQTMPTPRAQITRLLRVQNPILWQLYSVKCKQLTQELGQQDINEFKLFHGTKSNFINAICRDNFDWRVCGVNGTAFGQGTYFARDASYSHGFTDKQRAPSAITKVQHNLFVGQPEQNSKGTSGQSYSVWSPSTNEVVEGQHIHKMFYARVLCGLYAIGQPQYRKPPPRDPSLPDDKCFNSCVDSVHKPQMYVIFDRYQCYPEYLIEYSN